MKNKLLKKFAAAGLAAVVGLSAIACGGSSDSESSDSGSAGSDTMESNSMESNSMESNSTGSDSAGTISGESGNQASADSAEGEAQDGGSAIDFDEDPYEVVIEWFAIGNTPTEENLSKVEEAVNAITVPAINCTVKLYPLEMNDASNATPLAISTGEKIDLACCLFTGIGTFVDQGIVIPLDDYIAQYGQDLSDRLGDTLAGGMYQDSLYGIPNAYIQSESYGLNLRKDLLDKYGITIDEDKYYTYDEISDIFATVKAGEGEGFYCLAGNTSSSEKYVTFLGTVDKLGATAASGVLNLNHDWTNTTVENIFASEDYKEFAEAMYAWAEAGYIPADAASNTDSDTDQLMTGNYLGRISWTTPGCIEGLQSNTGYEFVNVNMAPPYKSTDRYQSILWCVPITSERPDKAMQFLNFLYADNDVDVMLEYGLEGETYEVIEEDGDGNRLIDFVDGLDATTAPYYCYAGVYGDRLSWPVWTPNPITLNQDLQEFDDTVEYVSPALGYCFEITDDISAKYAAVLSVIEQYGPIISAGAVDPETSLAEFNDALTAAGIEDVIAANQAQLDAWLANQ